MPYVISQQQNTEATFPVAFNRWSVTQDQGQIGPESFEFITPTGELVCFQFYFETTFQDWFKFQMLAEGWRAERGVGSSITQAVLCPSYQKIIGMGERAIRLIVLQLRLEADDPDQWFWALQAITMQNPVNPEDQGNFKQMAKSWLKWAEDEGYAG